MQVTWRDRPVGLALPAHSTLTAAPVLFERAVVRVFSFIVAASLACADGSMAADSGAQAVGYDG